MSVFWLFAHLLGYGAFLAQMSYLALCGVVGRRDARRGLSAARRVERIARMELQLGIGLDYGREWLLSQKVRCDPMYARLVAEGNGACERVCWGCDRTYRPHDEYREGEPSWYSQDKETRELTDRLCRKCYLGATTELDTLAGALLDGAA